MRTGHLRLAHEPVGAFTLIEVLVVIGIITVLAALLFPAVGAMLRTADVTATKQLINDLDQSIQVYAASTRHAPRPDAPCFIEFDGSIGTEPADLASYDSWPVLNKLKLKTDFSFATSALLPVAGGRARLPDQWRQPLRYVLGPGDDDHGHSPHDQKRPDWNWDPVTDSYRRTTYPYIYSYGVDNPDGADVDAWIYNADVGEEQ